MVVNPEDRSSLIEAQIISMRQFHLPQIAIFSAAAVYNRLYSKLSIIGPPAKRHLNGVSLAGR